MCYMNCKFENHNGECLKGSTQLSREACPYECDDTKESIDDNLPEIAEEKKPLQ